MRCQRVHCFVNKCIGRRRCSTYYGKPARPFLVSNGVSRVSELMTDDSSVKLVMTGDRSVVLVMAAHPKHCVVAKFDSFVSCAQEQNVVRQHRMQACSCYYSPAT